MKPSHGHDAEGPNPITPPTVNAPTGGRHYIPSITVGPIPGLPIPEPQPVLPEPTFKETLAAAQASEEAYRNAHGTGEDPTNPGLTPIDDLPTVDIFENDDDLYKGPAAHLIPMPSVAWPTSMVDATHETPKDVWDRICGEATKKRRALPQTEAQDLWAVYTGRPGKLMLIVCPERDLVTYLDGMFPCPVLISGAPAFMTLEREAQSLSGYARHGAAAAHIRRLAYFDQDRAKVIQEIRDRQRV